MSATWKTSDLGTAAFVHMSGLKLRGAVASGRRGGGKFNFVFEDPDERGRDLQVAYLNSECRRFDAAVRSMKKLCYDGNDKRS